MRTAALISLLLVSAMAAPAWNATGHRVISALAYDSLTPAARARVDDLIRRHPDYETIFVKDAPKDPAARARFAFMTASTWPDLIRNDPRFYNEDRADAKPTPVLPGFPDMVRHTVWHYRDRFFSQDSTPFEEKEVPNAIAQIGIFTRAISQPTGSSANPVYALPWLLHLIEDVHNPLHTVARFSKEHPEGDQGGNLVYVEPGRNLHAFWDGLAGDATDLATIDQVAAGLRSATPARPLGLTPDAWAQEGYVLAWSAVYTFGPSSGTQDQPLRLTSDYQAMAKQLGRNALLAAGQRLAETLNRELH